MLGFRLYSSSRISSMYFGGFFYVHCLMAAISLFGFYSGTGFLNTCAILFFLLLVAFLSLDRRYQQNPLSYILSFFTLLTFSMPLSFIALMGHNYRFGDSIGDPPSAQSSYWEILSLAIVVLGIFWLLSWLVIVGQKKKNQEIYNSNYFKRMKLAPLIIVGFFVFFASLLDNLEIVNMKLSGASGGGTEFLAFLFFDHSYLFLSGTALVYMLNQKSSKENAIKIYLAIVGIFLSFTLLMFLGGSKAAVMVIFLLFLLYPMAALRKKRTFIAYFPSPNLFIVIAMIAPILFYLAFLQRMSLATGTAPTFATLIENSSKFEFSLVAETLKRIFYRFSQGGLDQFILIFNSFVINSYDSKTAIDFFIYFSKNLTNLLLPGTLFPEAYAPTSQIFPDVLLKKTLGWSGGSDKISLLRSFNTQPYTVYGLFVILFGWLSPIAFFASFLIFIKAFTRVLYVPLSLTMIYFFAGFLPCYGPEAVIGNSFNFFISIVFLYYLTLWMSDFITLTLKKRQAQGEIANEV